MDNPYANVEELHGDDRVAGAINEGLSSNNSGLCSNVCLRQAPAIGVAGDYRLGAWRFVTV